LRPWHFYSHLNRTRFDPIISATMPTPHIRKRTSNQGRNSKSPTARSIAAVSGKFKVGTAREERVFLHRRRLLQGRETQKQQASCCQVFSAAADPLPGLIEPHPAEPPLPSRRRGSELRVTWDEQVRVLNIVRSKRDRMAQRAYLIALRYAKELRKQNAPDEFIDAFFEMEEGAVEIFYAAEPSQMRSQVKSLVRRRLSVHKVIRNEHFRKALLAMGHDILRLTERTKRSVPSSSPREIITTGNEGAPPKPPPPSAPAQPQCFNIVSPTRVRVFIPSWFANESADRSAGCDADVVGCPNDYTEAECNYSDLQAMVLAIVDSP
jgi:hypothetical protein